MCVPPLNGIAAKFHEFNENVMEACYFFHMSTYKHMKLTQKTERERARVRICFYESCVRKQNSGKYCHLYFQEPCALTNHTEEIQIVLYPPGNYAITQVYIRSGSELQPSNMAESKNLSGTERYSLSKAKALGLWSDIFSDELWPRSTCLGRKGLHAM